jgi:hypothetical protein
MHIYSPMGIWTNVSCGYRIRYLRLYVNPIAYFWKQNSIVPIYLHQQYHLAKLIHVEFIADIPKKYPLLTSIAKYTKRFWNNSSVTDTQKIGKPIILEVFSSKKPKGPKPERQKQISLCMPGGHSILVWIRIIPYQPLFYKTKMLHPYWNLWK